ncbi:MAG TPA: hypothetical protein VES40_11245 [Ilumatobacteraceae bacterium]|nr:hypothetical protein [Ilumatobacteraceae bacterium]
MTHHTSVIERSSECDDGCGRDPIVVLALTEPEVPRSDGVLIGESIPAIEAGRIMSFDELGGAATYDETMQSSVARVVDVLSSG